MVAEREYMVVVTVLWRKKGAMMKMKNSWMVKKLVPCVVGNMSMQFVG